MSESPEHKALLAQWLLGQADDQMILAHRNSEWTGHAPILEEDIAFANIALDEMGHAHLLYQIHTGLLEQDAESYPDALVFQRQAPSFRNVRLVEQPNGDWARTILRQYLFDAWESVVLTALVESGYQPLAEAAAVMRNEEKYHLHHSRNWVLRLGLGTEESHQRMQVALDSIWRLCQQLFELEQDFEVLESLGWLPDFAQLKQEWLNKVQSRLDEAELKPPVLDEKPILPRSQHGEQLMALLGEMQMVARIFPGEEW
jgi:ring-1,2-phenylacetyl-CoA epoxidase subunit PaaC